MTAGFTRAVVSRDTSILESARPRRYASDCEGTLSRVSEIRSYTVHFLPAEEGGYTVEVPRLPGCVTEGDTFEEALANAHEAIALYLESLAARGLPTPDDEATVVTRVAVQAVG